MRDGWLQGGGVALAVTLLAAMPPAHGRMLLIPLTDAAAERLLPIVRAHDALLLGAGPLRNSFVVDGDRAALTRALMPRGVAIVAAPDAACGDDVAEGAT